MGGQYGGDIDARHAVYTVPMRPITLAEAERAALIVCGMARDAYEARELLEVVGLGEWLERIADERRRKVS